MGKVTIVTTEAGKVVDVKVLPKCHYLDVQNEQIEVENQNVPSASGVNLSASGVNLSASGVNQSHAESSVIRSGVTIFADDTSTDETSTESFDTSDYPSYSPSTTMTSLDLSSSDDDEVEWSHNSNLDDDPGPSSGNVVRSTSSPVIGNDYRIPNDPEENEFDRFMERLEQLNDTLSDLLLDSEIELLPPPSYEEVIEGTWNISHQRRITALREIYSSNNSYSVPTRQHQPVSVNDVLTTVAGGDVVEHSLVNTLGTVTSSRVESGGMEELIQLIMRHI